MQVFRKVQNMIRQSYAKVLNECSDFASSEVKGDLRVVLEEFDLAWVTFEKVCNTRCGVNY